MNVIAFDPNCFTERDRTAIENAARAKGFLVEFGKGDDGDAFAILWRPTWTSFGVVKEGRAWHAYDENGRGLTLEGDPAQLIKRLAEV